MSSTLPRARGFTLMEVLVTLALMSLIATILIESLRVGGHTWQRVTRQAANIEEIARAQSFLRDHLETLHPGSLTGESDALEFSSLSPALPGEGLVPYRLERSASQPGDLEIRYRARSEIVVARTNGLTIQYWEEPTASPGRWVSHWPDPTKLPRLIRIDVRFADNDPRRWPPLYVGPRIDTRSTCVFDVVSRRCRDGV